jgi:hypothetical protein
MQLMSVVQASKDASGDPGEQAEGAALDPSTAI